MNIWKIQANSFNQLAYECSKNEITGLLRVNTYKRGGHHHICQLPHKLFKEFLFRFYVKRVNYTEARYI